MTAAVWVCSRLYPNRLAARCGLIGSVDDALYREAEKAFGSQGLVDMAALIGAYHGVCTTLTMFNIAAPA
jgi:4-carboxymuconolactone decarboxylase